MTHRRRVVWRKRENRVTITDELRTPDAGATLPPALWTLVLHPDCRVTRLSGRAAEVRRDGLVVRLTTAHGVWQERRGNYSPTYGVRQECPLLVIEMDPGVPRNVITITWRSGGEET